MGSKFSNSYSKIKKYLGFLLIKKLASHQSYYLSYFEKENRNSWKKFKPHWDKLKSLSLFKIKVSKVHIKQWAVLVLIFKLNYNKIPYLLTLQKFIACEGNFPKMRKFEQKEQRKHYSVRWIKCDVWMFATFQNKKTKTCRDLSPASGLKIDLVEINWNWNILVRNPSRFSEMENFIPQLKKR